MESVRIILTKNLSKKKPCAKQTSKNLWQDKKFYETVQQDCWKQDLSGEEEKSDLCQRQSSGTSQYNAKVKVKVKFSLEQATKAQRGSRCIALLLLQPQHQVGVGSQRHAPAALPPGKTRYPLYRRLGGPQGRSGWMRKISPPPGFDPQTVQPIASCYTN